MVENTIKDMLTTFRHGNCMELEVNYASEVTASQFNELKRAMQQSALSGILKAKIEKRYIDLHFANSVRCRTEIGFPAKVHQKTRIRDLKVTCDPIKFHFCLNSEVPLSDQQVGSIWDKFSAPQLVRLQRVWEFDYKEAFRYCLKEVGTGTTKQEAANSILKYEIEIELIPHAHYFNAHSEDDIVASFLAKCYDLIPSYLKRESIFIVSC